MIQAGFYAAVRVKVAACAIFGIVLLQQLFLHGNLTVMTDFEVLMGIMVCTMQVKGQIRMNGRHD